MDQELAQFARMAGVSVDNYLLKPKQKIFPAIDLRIDPESEEKIFYTDHHITRIKDNLVNCFSDATPDIDDPTVCTIIQEVLEMMTRPSMKLITDIYQQIYPSDISESSVIVPEIETKNGTPRYSILVDVSGDVSILDSTTGDSKVYSGISAADIKSHVKTISGSELQKYLEQYFENDSDGTLTEDLGDSEQEPVEEDWADQAVEVAEYLAELITEMENKTLIDTFLIGQLSNFVKRHGFSK
jgi:hypothetical protein